MVSDEEAENENQQENRQQGEFNTLYFVEFPTLVLSPDQVERLIESQCEVQPLWKRIYVTRGRIASAKPFHLPTKSVGFQLLFGARPVEAGFVMRTLRTGSGTAAHHCLVSTDKRLNRTLPRGPRQDGGLDHASARRRGVLLGCAVYGWNELLCNMPPSDRDGRD